MFGKQNNLEVWNVESQDITTDVKKDDSRGFRGDGLASSSKSTSVRFGVHTLEYGNVGGEKKEDFKALVVDMIHRMQDPNNSKRLLDLVRKFCNIGYRVHTQKSVSFVYTNNHLTERGIRESFHTFHNSIQKNWNTSESISQKKQKIFTWKTRVLWKR